MRYHAANAQRPLGGRAFTLLELLVVVAVLALLLSILLPALGAAQESGRSAKCLANERSIGIAMVAYCSDNDGGFPVSSHSAGSIIAPGAWLNSLQDYGVIPGNRICPSDPFALARAASYATNEHFEPLQPGIDYNPVTRRPLPNGRTRVFSNFTRIPRPSATIYAYEPAGEGTVDHLNTHQFMSPDDVAASIAVTRHRGACNFVFVDGHARPWPWSSLSTSYTPASSPFDPETAR